MSILHVIGFWLKVGHMLWWWIVSVMSMNWLIMTEMRKSDDLVWERWSNKMIRHQYIGSIGSKKRWWRKVMITWIVFWMLVSIWVFWYMNSQGLEKRKDRLGSMCDERARMLQDQFNVSMNHIQAMSILISTFHHAKKPSAIDQRTFARYTERTAFERPLTSGVAYAVRVLESEREEFEKEQGWSIKPMDSVVDQQPSPIQHEYAPVIFAQDTISHVVSLDMLSGNEDRQNVLRARASGKGVLTAPFRLIKSNRLGVILTFAVYNTDLPSNATPNDRIQATDGYLGGVFDIESLVENLLQQLASKHTILVNVYDTTNISQPISMYGSSILSLSLSQQHGLEHVSPLNFGDPFRKHHMLCTFKQNPPWPWLPISAVIGILVIALLLGHIFHATANRIAKVEDDYHEMMELKKRAEAADVAKSQFLATVSHEIRTPMNGVLGMLDMLMDTDLDVTQQDYVRTAQGSGKALVSLINEVLDQAKIESGKLELEAVRFDLRAILDDVLSLFSGKSQEKGVELAVYISDKVPEMLIGDPGRFRQIITNLMGNSIKFTEEGHIYVTVHLVEEVIESIEVETSSSSSNNNNNNNNNTLSGLGVADRRQSWAGFRCFSEEGSSSTSTRHSSNLINVIVSVEDTGVGIPLSAQSRVFTPFMQVGPSISRIHGGTGIGLSISKCLVGLMKGEIGFVSLPKIGSTFTFTAVFNNGCNDNQSSSNSVEFRGMTALVVDPRIVRAKASTYHIQRLGIHVQVAADLSVALSILSDGGNNNNNSIDMILIEQEVWDKDSTSSALFVNKLSSGGVTPSPRLFLLANSTKTGLATTAATPSVIVKPLRVSMLAASLQRALGNKGIYRNGEQQLPSLSLSHLLVGRKILVVDDNKVNLRVAAAALNKYGADVVCADTARKAISLLEPPHQFDACFMDIQMPEMDGFEATRRIRDMEYNYNNRIEDGVSRWHLPIMAMTADVIQATNEECLKCGMNGYVSKPFEAEQLYREVSRFFL